MWTIEKIKSFQQSTNFIEICGHLKKYNLTSSQEGVSLELFDPRKKLHYLMTFWKNSKSSTSNSAIDAIKVIKHTIMSY